MNTALFYDTETTGLPLFSEPSEDPRQPHMAQLAACLVDLDTRKTLASIDLIIKPEGWAIPEEVTKIHGISTELALAVGVPEAQAVNMLLALWNLSKVRVGHNEPFDARILRIALKRYTDDETADRWKGGASECTQRLATPICAIAPTERMRAANRTHYKSPNLSEAFAHLCGGNLLNAHSAMADTQACMRVYFAIKDHAEPKPEEQCERQAVPAF